MSFILMLEQTQQFPHMFHKKIRTIPHVFHDNLKTNTTVAHDFRDNLKINTIIHRAFQNNMNNSFKKECHRGNKIIISI